MFTGRGQAEGALPVQGLEETHPHHVQGLRPAKDWGSVQRSSQVNLKSANTSWDGSQTTSMHSMIGTFFLGRKEFLKNARVKDIRVIDMTIIKVPAV